MDSRVVATERLCCTIAAILKDPDFSLDTPRMVLAKETAQQLLDASLSVDESRREVFTSFALKLDKKLCEIATPSNNKKVSTQRMKLCSKFHSSRVTDLRQLWKELSVSLKFNRQPY